MASVLVLAAALGVAHAWSPVDRRSHGAIVVAGVLDCAANACYLLALDDGELTWVAAITSLYPATTVLLAAAVLHERLTRLQVSGMGLAAVALVLVAVGR